MRLGTENRTKMIAAAVLGVVALILVLRFMFGDSGSAAAPVNPAAPTPVRAEVRILPDAMRVRAVTRAALFAQGRVRRASPNAGAPCRITVVPYRADCLQPD